MNPNDYEEAVGTHTTNAWNVVLRIVAVFVASALATIGGASLLGIDTWAAAALAGVMAVATVLEKLARNFVDDGKLEGDEINKSFNGQ